MALAPIPRVKSFSSPRVIPSEKVLVPAMVVFPEAGTYKASDICLFMMSVLTGLALVVLVRPLVKFQEPEIVCASAGLKTGIASIAASTYSLLAAWPGAVGAGTEMVLLNTHAPVIVASEEGVSEPPEPALKNHGGDRDIELDVGTSTEMQDRLGPCHHKQMGTHRGNSAKNDLGSLGSRQSHDDG